MDGVGQRSEAEAKVGSLMDSRWVSIKFVCLRRWRDRRQAAKKLETQKWTQKLLVRFDGWKLEAIRNKEEVCVAFGVCVRWW